LSHIKGFGKRTATMITVHEIAMKYKFAGKKRRETQFVRRPYA
jgi:hypothetical protein